jgi:hypothetical protein
VTGAFDSTSIAMAWILNTPDDGLAWPTVSSWPKWVAFFGYSVEYKARHFICWIPPQLGDMESEPFGYDGLNMSIMIIAIPCDKY